VILAHVDEMEVLAPIQAGFDVRDRALFDAGLRLGNQRKETRAMIHIGAKIAPSHRPELTLSVAVS
jgi:hypothetical protein